MVASLKYTIVHNEHFYFWYFENVLMQTDLFSAWDKTFHLL